MLKVARGLLVTEGENEADDTDAEAEAEAAIAEPGEAAEVCDVTEDEEDPASSWGNTTGRGSA